jgi:hypothetical protein
MREESSRRSGTLSPESYEDRPRKSSQDPSMKSEGDDAPVQFGTIKVLDLSPVIVVRFHEGWTFDDMRAAYDRVADICPPRFILVTDAQFVRPVGAVERQVLSDILRALLKRLDTRVVVSIIVTDSALMRGVARAILWFVPATHKIVMSASMSEAYDVATEYATRERLRLHPSMATRLR